MQASDNVKDQRLRTADNSACEISRYASTNLTRSIVSCHPVFQNIRHFTAGLHNSKLEGPNYQHKFAAGRKSLFHFDVERVYFISMLIVVVKKF